MTIHLPNILVFTPIYRLEPETVQAVMGQVWDAPITWHFQRDNPYAGDGHRNILHQYTKGRDAFLAGNYTHMFVVESDIIPPLDALAKLHEMNTDCAYGVYRFRVSNVINIYRKHFKPQRNPGSSLSLYSGELKEAVKKRFVECTGGGLGCVLIKRRVLEKIPFRLDGKAHCDTYFNKDVMKSKFKAMADMSIICGHKTDDGRILYPEGMS